MAHLTCLPHSLEVVPLPKHYDTQPMHPDIILELGHLFRVEFLLGVNDQKGPEAPRIKTSQGRVELLDVVPGLPQLVERLMEVGREPIR